MTKGQTIAIVSVWAAASVAPIGVAAFGGAQPAALVGIFSFLFAFVGTALIVREGGTSTPSRRERGQTRDPYVWWSSSDYPEYKRGGRNKQKSDQ